MTAPDEAVEAAAEWLPHAGDCEVRPERDCTCWNPRVELMRHALEAAAPFIAAQASSREWGVTYADECGDLHTEWGYTRNPFDQIDKDGEIQVGKRGWGKVYEIKSRPIATEATEWQSDDCPWRHNPYRSGT